MKFFNWIAQHKYPLMVTAFFLMVALLLYIFLQSLKKDHTMDLVKQQMILIEERNKAVQQERETLNAVIKTKDDSIQSLRLRYSIVKANITAIDSAISKLPVKYNEKAKIINGYSNTELLQYYLNLPVQH